ncbi:hypothetical protein A6452_38410 [Bradyrhizobium elkanii]|nr:hypothetical protein A6452_38410 [Bradyrhizobium elkanii]
MLFCKERIYLGASRRQAARRHVQIGAIYTIQNIFNVGVIRQAIGVCIFGLRFAKDNLRPIRPERREVAADFIELEPSGVPSDPGFALARGR